MTSPLVVVLPYALGAAVSPFLLTVEVLILASGKQPKLRAWLYCLGAAIVTAGFITVIALGMRSLHDGSSPGIVHRSIEFTLGVVLLLLAIRTYFHKAKPGDEHEDRVQRIIQDGKPWAFFVIGVLAMITNLSSLVIIIPGVRAVQDTDTALTLRVAAFAILTVVTLLPAVVPVALVTVLGSRADGILRALNTFVTKHNKIITVAICAVVAVVLIVNALK